jgi:hypothetical protein
MGCLVALTATFPAPAGSAGCSDGDDPRPRHYCLIVLQQTGYVIACGHSQHAVCLAVTDMLRHQGRFIPRGNPCCR